MIRQARNGGAVLVKIRDMTGRTPALTWLAAGRRGKDDRKQITLVPYPTKGEVAKTTKSSIYLSPFDALYLMSTGVQEDKYLLSLCRVLAQHLWRKEWEYCRVRALVIAS
jgi:hypothetical protein